MEKYFQIGGFAFRLICSDTLPIPPNFLLFETEDSTKSEYTYRCDSTDTLPLPSGNRIAQREDLLVYALPSGEGRWIGVRGKEAFYACYQEKTDGQAEVRLYLPEIEHLHIDPIFTSLFALERQMIRHDSLILHCAYVRCQRRAILFSAPSGVGKSTQADLWKRFRQSETINGDRALLRKIDGVWNACGWPVCGSSEICHAEDTPIRAIVMLRQGKENHAERLSLSQAFSLLYAQITVNRWNVDFVQRALSLLEELIREVPVYQLTCTISRTAVEVLEDALQANLQ